MMSCTELLRTPLKTHGVNDNLMHGAYLVMQQAQKLGCTHMKWPQLHGFCRQFTRQAGRHDCSNLLSLASTSKDGPEACLSCLRLGST